MRSAAQAVRGWRVLAAAAAIAALCTAAQARSGETQASVVAAETQASAAASFLDRAEAQIAREVEDLPPWLAKSTRESKADVPGLDFTQLFAKSVAQIVTRDG